MTTPVIIDAIAIGILAGLTVRGAYKGLLRMLVGFPLLLLALAGAGMIASTLSAPAAKLITPIIEARMESRLEKALQERQEEMPEPGRMPEIGGIPDAVSLTELLDLLGIDEVRQNTLSEQAEEIIRDTGATMVAAVIESAAQSMLYGVLYMISLVLLSAALHLLLRMMGAVLKLPGLHELNACGGGLIGLAEGVVLLFLAVWLLRLLGFSFDWENGGPIYRFFTTYTPLDGLKFLGA